MGDWKSKLWSWFPIGPVGMRTLLLYIPSLYVYVIRVAQWHVGQRNATSPFEVVQKTLISTRTFATIITYALSAFFYSEVYIYTRYTQGKLQFTLDHGKFTERIKLNERPVYLRFLFMALAVIQAAVHLWCDYDQIRIPLNKPEQKEKKDIKGIVLYVLLPLATKSATSVATAFGLGTFIYFGFLRDYIWHWHYCVARFLVSLSKNPKPTGLAPFMNLVIIFLVQGTFLAVLWNYTNHTFSYYISQEPLKKDKPITSDSKDPNGSLLNGLKAKREAAKAIAFWELAIITDRFPDRRQTIYGELERKKGPTYKQVADLCLAEIRNIHTRIAAVTNPAPRPQNGPPPPTPRIELVPQIAQPLKDGQIIGPRIAPSTRMEKVGALTSEIARTHSSPANVQASYAKEYIKKGQTHASSGIQQAETWWTVYRTRFAASPLGIPFRNTIARTATTVITGAPYSRISLLHHSTTALTNLTVSSLKEDNWGNWQFLVPEIIRVFTSTIDMIEAYMQTLHPHWTDVETLAKPESERRKVQEVEGVVEELRTGLERILKAFNEYLEGMDMSAEEIRRAKEVVGRGPEVAQIR